MLNFSTTWRRFWLRWLRVADAAAAAEVAAEFDLADPAVPHPFLDGSAENFIFQSRKKNALGTALKLGLTLKDDPNEIIGVCGEAEIIRALAGSRH